MLIDIIRLNPTLTDAEIVAECQARDWIAGEIWRINVLLSNTGELAKLVLVGSDATMPAELRGACLTAVHVVTSAQIQHLDTTNESYRTQFLWMLSALSGAGILSADTVAAITAICQQARHPGLEQTTLEDVAAARVELARQDLLTALRNQWAAFLNEGVNPLLSQIEAGGTVPTLDELIAQARARI